MLAMLPLANSVWLLIILGILCLALVIVIWVVLAMQEIASSYSDNVDEEYVQYTNVRVLDRPFDYEDRPHPYDWQVDDSGRR